jgi:hypothetical protein
MKVSLLTPIYEGSPHSWGKDLAYMLNKNGIVAKHVHSLPMLPEPCVYRKDVQQNYNANVVLRKIVDLYREIREG